MKSAWVRGSCIYAFMETTMFFIENDMIETFFLALVIILFYSVSLMFRGRLRRAGLPTLSESDPGDRPCKCPSYGINACDGCGKVKEQ